MTILPFNHLQDFILFKYFAFVNEYKYITIIKIGSEIEESISYEQTNIHFYKLD